MQTSLSPFAAALCLLAILFSPSAATAQGGPKGKGKGGRPPDNSAQLLAEPFKGITTDGEVKKGLFKIESTGVSTEPIWVAAEAFLKGLSEPQRARTVFPLYDMEGRQWDNRHFAKRQGVSFDEMTEAQRELAFGLFKATPSAKGVKTTRDIMRLNLIEFDHQRPVALDRSQGPTRNHIHSVVRTPNGNDYGKDLLRQHFEQHHAK